jgi:hypothetical protein
MSAPKALFSLRSQTVLLGARRWRGPLAYATFAFIALSVHRPKLKGLRQPAVSTALTVATRSTPEDELDHVYQGGLCIRCQLIDVSKEA